MKKVILHFIYVFLRGILRIVIHVFYPGLRTINKEQLHFDGPAIVVSNHPNTLLDVLLVGVFVKQQVYFLANSGLFKGRFNNWFFNTFYCIPVERPQDTDGRPIDNNVAFRKSYDHLQKGGVLFIAVEGVSFVERKLRPIKTGAARIALGAESERDFNLGVSIRPVGLTYEAPRQFGTGVVMNVADPMWMKDYEELYKEDSIKAARVVTRDLEVLMKGLIVHLPNDMVTNTFEAMEPLLKTEYPDRLEAFRHCKRLEISLNARSQDELAEIQKPFLAYQEKLQRFNITDRILARPGSFSLRLMGMLLGFPFYFWGLVHNIIPSLIPLYAIRKLKLYHGYNSAVKSLLGLFVFPIYYFILYKIAEDYIVQPWLWIYILSMPFIGFFAFYYHRWGKRFFRHCRLVRMDVETKNALLEERKVLLELLGAYL